MGHRLQMRWHGRDVQRIHLGTLLQHLKVQHMATLEVLVAVVEYMVPTQPVLQL